MMDRSAEPKTRHLNTPREKKSERGRERGERMREGKTTTMQDFFKERFCE